MKHFILTLTTCAALLSACGDCPSFAPCAPAFFLELRSESGEPLSEVSVVSDTGRELICSQADTEDGAATFCDARLELGERTLTIEAAGHDAQTLSVEIIADGPPQEDQCDAPQCRTTAEPVEAVILTPTNS